MDYSSGLETDHYLPNDTIGSLEEDIFVFASLDGY